EVSDKDLNKRSVEVNTRTEISTSNAIGGRDNIVIYDKDGNKITNVPPSLEVDSEKQDCYDYIIDEDKGIEITGYDKTCGTDVSIPTKIDGINVYKIGEGAFKNKGITNVTIYKGIEEIGYGAFQGNNINTVKLAISVKTVGAYAFYNSKIKTLIMSEGIESIGTYAFAGNNICSVSFPSSLRSIGSYAFYNNCLTKVSLPAGVKVAGGTFAGNDIDDNSAFIYSKNSDGTADYSYIVGYAGNKTSNVMIPAEKNGVALKTIGQNAFSSTGLTGHIEIPATVTTIGSDAFAFNKISSLTLHEGLKKIDTGAFRSNQLTEINIPNSVTQMGQYVFNTNKVTGAAGIIYGRKTDGTGADYSIITGWAGGGVGGTIEIPAEVNGIKLKRIKGSAFADSNLTSITIPSLTEVDQNFTIENNAFIRNKIPASFTSEYGDGGFFYKVTNGAIDYSDLSSYGGIQNGVSGTITIPESYKGVSLKKISGIFSWMSYKKIVIPATVETMATSGMFGHSARNNPNLVTIVNKTGKSFNWATLTASSYTTNNTFVTGTIKHEAGNIEVISE
ncbi:MAG: leucine-rich repeat domain-containing protein, partial [Bacilli bacterium]|nr:leucine-rich repeat domain-containing protein [Bacilli bacterium]